MDGVIVDAGERIGEPGLRIDVVELRGLDQRGHGRRPVGTTFGAGEEPRLSAKCKSPKSTLGRIIRQADPAVVDKAGEPVPAPQHVVDRLDHRGRARHSGSFITQPRFQSGQKRSALLPAYAQTFFGAQAVDVALDIEQRVNALDRFQRNR